MREVLILSHQGYSFLDDLVSAAQHLGLEVSILSSKPLSAEREGELVEKFKHVWFSESECLSWKDVKIFLAEKKKSNALPSCVISVWEGYRELMARANELLGADDVSEEVIASVRDKYSMRRRLNIGGLSSLRVSRLSESVLNQWKLRNRKAFIKPRTGLGSFAAFPLKESTSWNDIVRLWSEAVNEKEYQGIFEAAQPYFIIEDQAKGTEYSFEVLANRGGYYHLATHEKLELELKGATVLENSCTSPPVSISRAEAELGFSFVSQVLSYLGCETGLYHVEAKYDGSKWEIIEINPRVGGALIKESTKEILGGSCVLELWLSVLLGRNIELKLQKNQSSLRTFFRVYFAQPGKTLKSIQVNETITQPSISQKFMTSGKKISKASREHFLGQALWIVPEETSIDHVKKLNQISTKYLEVSYVD